MKLNWQDAPTQTQWGHDMVVATVALGKDHSVDMYCERSKTAEAEALLKKPWVGLTDEDIVEGLEQSWVTAQAFQSAVWWAERQLKEKNT
jgi:hypothetical protein